MSMRFRSALVPAPPRKFKRQAGGKFEGNPTQPKKLLGLPLSVPVHPVAPAARYPFSPPNPVPTQLDTLLSAVTSALHEVRANELALQSALPEMETFRELTDIRNRGVTDELVMYSPRVFRDGRGCWRIFNPLIANFCIELFAILDLQTPGTPLLLQISLRKPFVDTGYRINQFTVLTDGRYFCHLKKLNSHEWITAYLE